MSEEVETDTATEEEVAAMPSNEVTDTEEIPDQGTETIMDEGDEDGGDC